MGPLERLEEGDEQWEGTAALASALPVVLVVVYESDQTRKTPDAIASVAMFRFYNAHPGDWVEGANEGHRYELRFVTEPTAAQRGDLAERYELALSQGPATTAREPWKWSGPFAYFQVGERWIGHPRAAFAKVVEMVRSMNAIAPLEHAAFLGAFESKEWPPAVQPPPGVDAVRSIDDALPELAVDPDFEEARAAARKELAKRRLRASVLEAEGLTFVDFPIDSLPQEDEVEKAAARRVFDVPDPQWIDKGAGARKWKEAADGDHPIGGKVRRVAYVKERKRNRALAYEVDGQRRLVTGFPDDVHNLGALAVCGDGARGIIAVDREVWEIDFEQGTASFRWAAGESVHGVVDLSAVWIVKTESEVVALDPSGEEVRAVARLRLKEFWGLYLAVPGAVVALSKYGKDTRFVGYCAGKLKTLAKVANVSGWVTQADGEVVFVTSTGDARTAMAVGGLDELYGAWAKPLLDKAAKKSAAKSTGKKSSKRSSKRAKASLVEVDAAPPAEPPNRPPMRDEDRAATVGGHVTWAPSGTFVGTTPDPEGTPNTHQRVTWKREGTWHHARFNHLYPDSVRMSPDDALIVVSTTGSALAVDAADGSHVVFRRDATEAELGLVRQYLPLSRDDVVIQADKGVEWWTREGDALIRKWSAKVGGLLRTWVDRERGIVVCRSKNKHKLVVFDDAGKKRGAFEQPFTGVRMTGAGIFVLLEERQAFRLVL